MLRQVGIGLAACSVLILANGCKRPPAVDPTVVEAVAKQPGAAEVMAAVEKKDFDGVMAALGKVQAQVTTEEQKLQFMQLAYQAREKISEVAPNDPKAMEVVAALRTLVTGGR